MTRAMSVQAAESAAQEMHFDPWVVEIVDGRHALAQKWPALPSRSSGSVLPVPRATVVLVEAVFVVAIDRVRAPFRAVLDELSGHVDVHFSFVPAHASRPLRCKQHLLAEPPVAGVGYQVAQRPGLLVDDEIF